MSVVGTPPTGVIVNIPGTELWGPGAGDNPMDLTGNAEQAGWNGWSAGSEATADAIAQLYESNGIPPGTPLMLNGHSQGGMIASSLAANEGFASQFNVTNITLDSPSWNPLTNHSSAEYQQSVQTQLQDPNSALSQYSQDPSLQPFLQANPDSVQHYTSGVHRDN